MKSSSSPAGIVAHIGVKTIAVVSALCVLADGPSPTGGATIDAILLFSITAAVTLFAAVVPVRYAALLTLIAGAASVTWPGLAAGVISYAAASAFTPARARSARASAALIGLSLNLAARSDLDWFLGASVALGSLVAGAAIVRAIPLHPPRVRRRLAIGAGLAAVISAAAVASVAVSAAGSREDLRTGEASVRRGVDQLLDGDVDEAAISFDTASSAFDRAHGRLASPLNSLARLLPVVAQHHRAGVELTDAARRATETLVVEVTRIDLDRLTVTGGRIDVDAVAALADPLGAVRSELAALSNTVADIDTPWLADAVRIRLEELRDDVDTQLERSDLFVDLVDRVPDMLGRHEQRRYFVAFTTPTEARGLGGFMGNWAEITVDDGKIELTRFGRSDDLNDAAAPGARTVTGPADWLARYGQYGFDNAVGGGVGAVPWKNITMSASMESTGKVIAELYPQSGGTEIDGVFVLDVFTLSALLELTGPIELPAGEGTITAATAPQYLLNDQYALDDRDERVDVLETVSNRVFETLLRSEFPPPTELLALLGPYAEQERLSGYAVDPDEQALLRRAGLAGTLSDPSGADGLAVTFNNAIGNKIDYYFRSSADYHVVADSRTGTVEATLDLELRNEAPTDGQPHYVIGNPLQKPAGTNRTLVSVYSQLPLVSAELGGTPVRTEQTVEAGYFVTGVVVELDSGRSDILTLEFSGALDLQDGYRLVVRSPPLTVPVAVTVEASLVSDAGPENEFVEIVRPGRSEVTVGGSAS